ncbi:hypothetical protein HPHPH18_1257 [Helicobacter pylori Hp H-18]|nr:hypothetical protein HPHPH18_1257 [Helicobacter pylori Hp H-18]
MSKNAHPLTPNPINMLKLSILKVLFLSFKLLDMKIGMKTQ